MTQELKSALFAAEAVAHLHAPGFAREILPLADLARGQAKRIEELEAALREMLERCDMFPNDPNNIAHRKLLARTEP